MDIQQKDIDKLNAVLSIKLAKDDYSSAYNDALKSYRKQVSMPGFRPGHVPMSMVKKMYGKSILAEELNKVLSAKLNEHITENKLNVLGNPLPKEADDSGDWDNPGDFEFEYELGLAPEIKVSLSKKDKFTKYVVKIDDKMIDEQVNDLAKRYGSMSQPEVSEDKDMLMGTLVQLNDKDEILEGGVMSDSTISIEFIEDKKTKAKLIGLKKDDVVVLDPHKISKGHDDMGRMLGISHEEVHDWKGNVNFKVNEIRRLAPSPIDQTLFDKVLGKDGVKDEAEFRARIVEDLTKMFDRDSDRLLKDEIAKHLVEKINPALPDDFLKRWIMTSNETEISMDQVEADYPNYAKGLQWRLIENQLIKDNEIQVSADEVLNHTKQMIASQYAQYGMPLDDEQLDAFAKNHLGNAQEVEKIYETLYHEKAMIACLELVTTKEKAVAYDDFVALFK